MESKGLSLSVEGIVHVEEDYPKEPDGNQDVVDGNSHVLLVFLDFDNQSHCVEDQHTYKSDPCHDCMENAIIQEIYAEERFNIPKSTCKAVKNKPTSMVVHSFYFNFVFEEMGYPYKQEVNLREGIYTVKVQRRAEDTMTRMEVRLLIWVQSVWRMQLIIIINPAKLLPTEDQLKSESEFLTMKINTASWAISLLINIIMQTGDLQKTFKEMLLRFYLLASNKYLHRERAQNNLIKLFHLESKSDPYRSQSSGVSQELKPPSERSSTEQRATKSKSDPNIERLKITINGASFKNVNTIQTRSSRSKSSARSQSSKAISNFGPLFHTEWVYTSKDPGKVIAFAYLTVCILRGYDFGFDKLYTLIRDHLRQKMNGVPVWALSAEKQWNLIRKKMRRETGSQWQKMLRRYVDNLADLLTNLVLMFAASPVNNGQPFNQQAARRLAFFAQTSVTFFNIDYKELKSIQKIFGSKNTEISIGFLQHRGVYVVAKNAPSLTLEGRNEKQLKGNLRDVAMESLDVLRGTEEYYELQNFNAAIDEKQNCVKRYLKKKIQKHRLAEV